MGQIIVKRQKGNEGEKYINAFPKLKKWINECLCCHEKGYNPSMPDKITTVDGSLEVYFIKKYFFKALHPPCLLLNSSHEFLQVSVDG